MKVGFYIGDILPLEVGGGSTFQMAVLEELQRTFKNEGVVYYKSKVERLFKDSNNFHFVNLIYKKLPKRPFWIRKKKWIKSTFDSVFLQDGIDALYYLVPYAFISQKIPYILTIWDLAHRNKTYFPEVSTINNEFVNRENFFKSAIQQAAYVVIGNSVGREQLCRYYGMDPERVKINPFTVPNYIFSQEADNSIVERNHLSKEKYLFYPAQFWTHKNHIRLLKAMIHLKKDGFKMVFTGSDQGNIEYVKSKISEFGLENDVLLLGFVTKNELIALYKHAYALTYASFFGPDNVPPLEAMALECPVICANFDGAEEQLGKAALFFDKLDEHSLINQVTRLKDKRIRANLIKEGKQLVKKRMPSSYIENINNILLEFEKIRECWK